MKKVNYKYYARNCGRYQLVGCFLFRKENSPRKKEEWGKIWGKNEFLRILQGVKAFEDVQSSLLHPVSI